jgi:signal transduction histidine kinase
VTDAVLSDFRSAVAHRIEASHEVLAARWLDELRRIVPVAENDIFPGDDLLGHIPALFGELAAFLRAPADQAIAANATVTARAAELGRFRYAQRASVHQVLREYRTLRTVIAGFIVEEINRLCLAPVANELIELMTRLEAAVDVLLQTTVETFVAAYTETITEHTSRLEGFNRMVTHELRQPLGIVQFAVKLLGTDEAWMNVSKRAEILATADRNVTRMNETLRKLLALLQSGDGTESALVQRVDLSVLLDDVLDQLHEMAQARGVDVRVASPLPTVTIDVARLELVLVNLISNAIKYSDPDKPERHVEIACLPDARPGTCVLAISDNGLGVAETELRSIFTRFYRGHAERDGAPGAGGLGLGLSIVADCVDALKGSIRVESALHDGTTFFVELPLLSGA